MHLPVLSSGNPSSPTVWSTQPSESLEYIYLPLKRRESTPDAPHTSCHTETSYTAPAEGREVREEEMSGKDVIWEEVGEE